MTDPDSRPQGFIPRTLRLIETLGLVLVLVATVVAIGLEVKHIVVDKHGHVELHDLLLFFIYLEVVAMIGIYFDSHRLPVRFVLYIAIVAMARHIILDMNSMSWQQLLATSFALILVAASVLVVRVRHRSLDAPED
jgi:protein PsiE